MDVQSRRHGCGLYELAPFMLDGVWPDVFVSEGILTVHVAALRRALGDTRRSPAFIETVSRSGYRFMAEVRELTAAEAATRGVRRLGRRLRRRAIPKLWP